MEMSSAKSFRSRSLADIDFSFFSSWECCVGLMKLEDSRLNLAIDLSKSPSGLKSLISQACSQRSRKIALDRLGNYTAREHPDPSKRPIDSVFFYQIFADSSRLPFLLFNAVNVTQDLGYFGIVKRFPGALEPGWILVI